MCHFNPFYRQEVCNNETDKYAGNYTMCPECEIYCPYWKLKKACMLSRVAYVFDNYATVFFSLLMSIWGKLVVLT